MSEQFRPGSSRILSVALLRVIFLLAPVMGRTHEITFAGFERALDRRESLALASGQSLGAPVIPATRADAQCELSLTLVDSDSHETLPGLVRIMTSDGSHVAPAGLVSRGLKLAADRPGKHWYVVTKPGVILVPRTQLRIEAFSGLETERREVALDLRGKATANVVITLPRIFSAKSAGWRSGNTHLHLRGLTSAQADEYLRTIPRGDGLELVFVSYLARAGADQDYISNVYTKPALDRLSLASLKFGNGEEHRHNFGAGGEGYGHVLFLNLPALVHPVSVGSGITGTGPDYPPLRPGIDQARRQGATIVWCHNGFGFEHIPSWISGRVHALNIFDGGTQGSYVQTYYRFLNLGLKVPFSTGTDWFMYDFSRVYVRLNESLTVESWLRGLAEGKTVITNGPWLEFQAGSHQIGDTVALTKPGRVGVRARAVGRVDFKGIELVHNGGVVAKVGSRASAGHFVAELEHPLLVEKSGWAAVRIPGGAVDTDGLATLPTNAAFRPSASGQNELGEALFAHTSPIYFNVAGTRTVDPSTALELMAAMEKSSAHIQAKGRFDDERQRREVLRIYRDGIEQLRRDAP